MSPIEIQLLGAGRTPALRAVDATFAACREIRRRVFIEEQRVDEALEFDGLDGESDHFLAFWCDGNKRIAAGTARLRLLDEPEEHATEAGVGKAERVAVLESLRGRGIGRALMDALEERARDRGLRRLVLHAQVAVIPFYEELGFQAYGDMFEEAGIEHREMDKRLSG